MSTSASDFAHAQTAALLERLHRYAAAVAADPDADGVHDLRVTIRRFKTALRVFGPLFDRGATKKIRRKLDAVMEASGAVRDRDITLALLTKAGIPPASLLVRELDQERAEAREALKHAAAAIAVKKWTGRLGLS